MPLASDSRPYIIYREPPGWGFWSNFTVVLQGLDAADRHGLTPVVDMQRYPTHYNEDGPVHGTSNAWEYYFEQPAACTLEEALACASNDDGNRVLVGEQFIDRSALISPRPEVLARGRELIRKYVRVRPAVLTMLDAVIPAGAGADYLGVHVRGTDQSRGYFPRHPVPAPPETYLEQALLLDREFSYARVFLATDERETVEMFAQAFGPRLLVLPAHRTSSLEWLQSRPDSYAWLFDAGVRQLHRYRLGLEVLLDGLALARCGHLLCGASNVSRAAMFFAAERQAVHPVTPLWCAAGPDDDSLGKAYLAALPGLARRPGIETLERHIERLHEVLAVVENERAKANRMNAQLREQLAAAGDSAAAMQRSKAEIGRLLDDERRQHQALRQAVTARAAADHEAPARRARGAFAALRGLWGSR